MGAPGYDVAVQHLLSEAGKVKALARDRTDLDIEARALFHVKHACQHSPGPCQRQRPRRPVCSKPLP